MRDAYEEVSERPDVHVVMYGTRFVASNPNPQPFGWTPQNGLDGWRPYVWTDHRPNALNFWDVPEAVEFAEKHLPHSCWTIGSFPSYGWFAD